MAGQNRQLSGVITVTTAGTEVNGPDVQSWQPAEQGGGFFIAAAGANTGYIYLGNDGAGAVASTSGYELKAGNQIFVRCNNLNELWFDSSVNGEKCSWLRG
jgi:hypothetical protein